MLRRIVPERMKDIRRLRNLLSLPSKDLPACVDYSQYDAIHFHFTKDLYARRKVLEGYRGKVLLTSHSPLIYHKELISKLNPKDVKKHAKELAKLEIIDHYAFERADAVIFPCREAEEPYFNTWSKYAVVRDEAKMHYVPTGIQPCVAKVSRREVRERHGIPNDAPLMCYVGRHNHIKGYDVLVEMALPLLDEFDAWMIVAGREGPLSAPSHPRWIEVGWTDDPHSVIAASDVFCLPNRETYFDLIFLEVLSLGMPIVASRTGGNKYFARFGLAGVNLYDSSEEFRFSVNRALSMSGEERGASGKANRDLFDERFSCAAFAKSYCDAVEGICV